jgi:hypothetical protein
MPELTEKQWWALVDVMTRAWELVDTPPRNGPARHTLRRDALTPLREALEAFEVASGGEVSDERVEIVIPQKRGSDGR